jgi:hypothetical protein
MKKYFFIIILFYSCQEEISLDFPQANNKLVVEGTIEEGYPPYIILTQNQGYFESIDFNTYNSLFVDNVDSINVWYYENDVKISKELKLIPTEISEAIFSIPIPIYTIADSAELISAITNPGNYNFSQAGRTYYLEIKWNNQVITSSTTIPEPTPLDCLWVEQSENIDDKDYKCDIRAIYSDPADVQNNVLIRSKRIQHYTRNDTLKCDTVSEPDLSLRLVDAGADVLINGQTFETYFPRPGDNGGFPSGKYNSTHYKKCNDGNDSTLVLEDIVLIKFCQIDEPSMKFWRSLVRQFGTNGNPFSEPMNLVSNINNGLGVWSGYGAIYYKVPIVKDTSIFNNYKPNIIDIF